LKTDGGRKPAKRSEMLANEQTGKLLFKLSMPAIIGMLVQALYNMVDTIFVGRGVGTMGIGGIAIVFPVQIFMMAVAQTVGIGGASIISRRLGAGDKRGAALTLGNMVLLSGFLSVAVLAAGKIFMSPVLKMFGATPSILPYAKDYFKIIILGAPLITFAMAVNNAARAEGNAGIAMGTMLVGAGLNIVLDPLFIFGLNMGIRGAAVATVISQAASATFLFIYFQSGKSEIHFGFGYLRIRWGIVKEIFAIGASVFARHGAMTVTSALINNALRSYGGDIGIAAFGVIFRVFSFFIMPMMGINQGLQPILGFNYGAGRYGRVMESFRKGVVSSTLYSSVGYAVLMLFPGVILGIFSSDPDLIRIGREAMRIAILIFPLVGFQIVGSGLFQALGKAVPALFLSLARQVLFLIPMVILLPLFLGLSGVWVSFPAADALSFLATLVLVLIMMKKLRADKGFSQDIP
jgi:putative MATE family efflux protein